MAEIANGKGRGSIEALAYGFFVGKRAARGARTGRMRRAAAWLAVVAGAALGSEPAVATQARFAPGFGFEAASLAGLPSGSIDASVPFLSAGESGTVPNLAASFVGSTTLCVLAPGSSVCQPANPPLAGPFSVLVSLQINSLSSALGDSFTLMLTSLASGLGYGPDDVAIELDPVVPNGLDTSAVPGFVWQNGFRPFVHVHDLYAPPSTVYDYVGWVVQNGSVVTFRYDVLTGLKGNTYPKFTANAVPTVIPEPGSALLLGLGLAGLALGANGRGSNRRAVD